MDKCRICFSIKRKLCSIFNNDNDVSYAEMITSVAQVKIVEGAYNNKICSQCSRKLRDLYTFKKELERSDLLLNEHLKILRFDTINDIKDIRVMKEFVDMGKNVTIDKNIRYMDLLKCNSTLYGNTTFTKILCQQNNAQETKDESVLDVGSVIYETDQDYDDFYDYLDTFSYDSSGGGQEVMAENKTKGKDSTKTKRSVKLNFKRVCLKPIILDNIRVVPSKRKPRKKLKDNKCKKRQDVCPYCGIMSSNIKSHLMVHIGEKKFQCFECNKAFFTSNQLKHHQSSHLMAGAYKCDRCVAVFNSKTSLQSHMVSHMDVKNHVCSVCNKGFKRKSALRRHKLIHISSAKSIKCEFCNMCFLFKQGLRHHMRVHTGERPFNCEICSQPYSYKHDFNRHCLKKHGVNLKRRSVHVMTEQVLMRERELMKDLMMKIQGVVKADEPLNPFQGPQAALAFNQAVNALASCQIPIDVAL